MPAIIVIIMLFFTSSAVASGLDSQKMLTFHGDHDATIKVMIADTPQKQSIGLMSRRYMPADQGMLFVFGNDEPRSFWMKNTYISLDQIYVDRYGLIIDINRNARPLSTAYYVSRPCRYVIEANGGYCDGHGIDVGDKVSMRD